MRHAALFVALAALGCSNDEFVIVQVHAIPSGVTNLIVHSALDEQPAQSAESFAAPSDGFGSDTSFALKLPSGTGGRLSVSAEAWIVGCAVASKSADAVLVDGQLMLDLNLDAIAPQDCSGRFEHLPDMVRVAGATFAMGCNSAVDNNCETDEVPTHMVTLSSYFIDRTEVSAAAYHRCRARGGCLAELNEEAPTQMAEASVTWDEAAAFCTTRGKRLPTEAEWEMAARGTDGRIYPWGNDAPVCSLANYFQPDGTHCYVDADGIYIAAVDHPSGASPFGAVNMAGNLEEWVADWYANKYVPGVATDPTGPSTGAQRVLRGGSWISSPLEIRATRRNANAPDASSMSLAPNVNSIRFGIRCARSQ